MQLASPFCYHYVLFKIALVHRIFNGAPLVVKWGVEPNQDCGKLQCTYCCVMATTKVDWQGVAVLFYPSTSVFHAIFAFERMYLDSHLLTYHICPFEFNIVFLNNFKPSHVWSKHFVPLRIWWGTRRKPPSPRPEFPPQQYIRWRRNGRCWRLGLWSRTNSKPADRQQSGGGLVRHRFVKKLCINLWNFVIEFVPHPTSSYLPRDETSLKWILCFRLKIILQVQTIDGWYNDKISIVMCSIDIEVLFTVDFRNISWFFCVEILVSYLFRVPISFCAAIYSRDESLFKHILNRFSNYVVKNLVHRRVR